jgi:hypothetical protein
LDYVFLAKATEGNSPRTVEYYDAHLRRFLWYANKEGWPDEICLIDEWKIKQFLSYVNSDEHRWGLERCGSESSARKAKPATLRCYYCKELEKAELSLKLGFKYVQDGA